MCEVMLWLSFQIIYLVSHALSCTCAITNIQLYKIQWDGNHSKKVCQIQPNWSCHQLVLLCTAVLCKQHTNHHTQYNEESDNGSSNNDAYLTGIFSTGGTAIKKNLRKF